MPSSRSLAAPLDRRRRRALRRRRGVTLVLVMALAGLAAAAAHRLIAGPGLSPLRARIVALAQSQVGYRTDPPDTYCNPYSAFWDAGTADCGNGDLDEEWCADFAAWVWKQAGAEVTYALAPGELNSRSASFYVWGVDHHTWHALGSHYSPQPGDVAVYGLDAAAVTADHVAIVVGTTGSDDAPDVVNGDGDRTGFSVVEVGDDETYADVRGHGRTGAERLAGYVSPTSAPASGG